MLTIIQGASPENKKSRLETLVDDLILPLLTTCQDRHLLHCEEADQGASGDMPTRLIDHGSSATSSIKLIDTRTQHEADVGQGLSGPLVSLG
ncbi:uncharacterized protein BO80DRAFT_67206 [Aspergillus ibericus CBS 121593]|uniref:Uncharacterized protein n=1 Tax=Aspergillus ibericus CBS 121593 TaxID=1448316 RepID=A0A395H0M8_9EURO|nr:hypothetical protein BO80DRAFT_67206 [Aspergillus ibericus CBS 121593]RAL01387.1 hypothetical protein BO80DRAFT_67206 [Aspergillus ibericus CBS 121593]